MPPLDLRCECGAVHGTVDPTDDTNHLTCYCESCRAFARFGSEQGGRDVTDGRGGTAWFQTSAGRIRLAGVEHLAALRMTARGPVRWYCGACGTPIANTMPTPALPFASFAVANLHGNRALLGPNQGAFFTGDATEEPLHPHAGPFGVMRMMGRFGRSMLRARMRGEHRRSPFHRDGRPIASAPVVDPEERRRLAALPGPTVSPAGQTG